MPDGAVPHEGGSVAYRDFGGHGQTVMLLHGLGGNLAHWGPLAPLLQDRYRLLAIDLPSHGASTAPAAYSFDTDVSAVDELRRHLGLDRPALVGHSYGGMLARLYASTYANEIAGMVLVDAFSEGLETQMTPEQWTAYEELFQPVPDALAGYEDLEFTDLDTSASQVREATAATPLRPIPLVVLSRGQVMQMPADLPGGLTGEGLEQAWSVEQDRLAALLPDARHVIARESEHYIQLQQPELVIEAVRQVVEDVRDPSSWGMSITGTPSP